MKSHSTIISLIVIVLTCSFAEDSQKAMVARANFYAVDGCYGSPDSTFEGNLRAMR